MALRLNDIEAAFRIKADQGLKALDGIVEKSERANRSFKNLTDATNKVGLGLTALGASITAAFGLAIRGAAAEAEQLAQLEGVVNSTGASFAEQRPRIESFITGLTRVTKFSDDELRPALNRAIIATNDVDKGMRAAELGAKIAAAGFGNIEGNATLVARLFEGQVQTIGRLIPEFRDLDERLEAGASQADIAAEALARLNTIAANAPSPQGITQLTKAIGELADTVGTTALETLGPFIAKLTDVVVALTKFGETTSGKVVTSVVLLGGVLATAAGGFLLLFKPLIEGGVFLREFANKSKLAADAMNLLRLPIGQVIPSLLNMSKGFNAGAIAARVFGAALAFATSPIGLILLLGGAIAGLSAHLNKLSREADEARDKLFQSDRLTQFTAEFNALQKAIVDYNRGVISATEAQKVFNKFGVENREEAGKRSLVLKDIIARLTEEKIAEESASKAALEGSRDKVTGIEAVIAAMDLERQARIELELLQEDFANRQLERGKKLAAQVTPIAPELPPQGGFGEPGFKELAQPAPPLAIDTDALVEPGEFFEANAAALAELGEAALVVDENFAKLDAGVEAASDQAQAFTDNLAGIAAGGLAGLAQLGGNLFVDLANGADNASQKAHAFFQTLIKDIGAAIVRSLILQAIIASVGGPTSGIGKLLFQDPRADQLARFEGQRFVDLFFQGVTREIGNARDRIDTTLTDNRQLVENRGAPTSIIVTEASPETKVEFTDRHIEPRVRARARQRTGTITSPFGQTA